MIKLMTTAALLALASTSAFAESRLWNVKEQSAAGITSSQGQWHVNVDADKLSGQADMQFDNGNTLTYKLDGEIKDNVYTVKMTDRSDGRNGCVWSGHIPEGADKKAHGLIGKVTCDGAPGFSVLAGF